MKHHRILSGALAVLTLCVTVAAPRAILAADPDPSDAPDRSVSRYTGAGTVIAVLDAGFDVEHPVFAAAPASPRLTAGNLTEMGEERWYRTEKLPYVKDYTDEDADVSNTSFTGTSAASLAAGAYTGAGDTVNEDGTVTHEASFFGSAPDAQLLLMKIAADKSVSVSGNVAARAISDAMRLEADVILIRMDNVEITPTLRRALLAAAEKEIPVLTGAGDVRTARGALPVTLTDTSTLGEYAALDGLTLVGSAADPLRGAVTFFARTPDGEETEISFTDSCEDYFGAPFAALFAGESFEIAVIPGVGREEDYAGIDCAGKIALVRRGEISFTEKAEAAAAAGAAAMIVTDTGDGVSRMAMEGAPVPGVMVDAEAGEMLAALEAGSRICLPDGELRAAESAGWGVSDDLSRTVSFLCRGENVTAAVPTDFDGGASPYLNVSGSYYAAAAAAGYVARAAQYCRTAGLDSGIAQDLCAAAAVPVTDGDNTPLSPRRCGAGLVCGEGEYPTAFAAAENGDTVSALKPISHTSASFDVHITNTADRAVKYTVSAAAFRDGYTDEEGTPLADGTSEALAGVRMYIGDSVTDICSAEAGERGTVITVAPGRTVSVSLTVMVPAAVRRQVEENFWYGFFLDGRLTLRGDDGTVLTHPFTTFVGDWAAAPLADATAYEGGDTVFGPATLHVNRGDTSVLLGVADPFVMEENTRWDMGYNLVSPALLRNGYVELKLNALRDIDQVTVSFFDGERRLIYRRTEGRVDKYLRHGTAVIPLWNFIAEDNENYLFPEGEYACEIRLSTNFAEGGSAVSFLGFTFTVDRTAPAVVADSLSRDGERLLLHARAQDNTALRTVNAYDVVYTFPGEEDFPAGAADAELVFDVTQYDSMEPLYIEATDCAGNYAVYRISPDEFEAMRAALDGAADESEDAAA